MASRKIKLFFVLFVLFYCRNSFPEKLTVLLDWFPNPLHGPLVIAKAKGFFNAQHLEVNIIAPADPADPPKLVAAGKADIAITYEPQLIAEIAQGLPLIRIGTLINKPLSCVAVLAKSPIYRIEDFSGKRIGYSTDGVNSVTLKTMLEQHALSLSQVEPINVHYNLTQALLLEKVDVITGIMRTFEVIQMSLLKHPVRVFFPEKNGVPAYSELVLVSQKDHIHSAKLHSFLIALQQGIAYVKMHPKESWDIFANLYPEANNELNHQAWFASLAYFADNPSEYNSKEWLQFATFMQKNHLISKVLPIHRYAINILQE